LLDYAFAVEKVTTTKKGTVSPIHPSLPSNSSIDLHHSSA
jgi:hypothetical protein